MRIRKFEASTLQLAMAKVKAELGEEAVILHTRSHPAKLFGLLGKPRVEVTAAIENQQPYYGSGRAANPVLAETHSVTRMAATSEARAVPRKEPSPAVQAAAHEFLSKIEKIRQSSVGTVLGEALKDEPVALEPPKPAKPEEAKSAPVEPSRLEALEVRLDRLANTMERLLSLGGPLGQMGVLAETPLPWHSAFKRLMESSLSEPILHRVAQKLKSIPHPGVEFENKILRELLAELVISTPPIGKPETGQRVITLVGPTGVGKTTTLAKLASGLVVNRMPLTRVGLITVDTYRLAAEDQLRKYAEILGLDLQVVYGPEEMPDAVRRCHDADVVFVDTAGRSPRDETQMAELRSFLDRVPDCEKYLVLSSTMSERYVEEAVERFRPLGVKSLIVTKLDETRNFAAPVNIHQVTGIPVSYITTGQNVPEDIESIDPGKIADEILASVCEERRQATRENEPLEKVSV